MLDAQITRCVSSRRAPSRSALALPALLLGMTMVVACDPPPRDSIRPGGASPIPSGVIEGTVLYVGPPPRCERRDPGDPGSEATAVIGRVVLTLFAYDNPPPPSGSATGALSALTVPGDEVFSLADCDATGVLMRSADFTWPDLLLGAGTCEDDGTGAFGPCSGRDYQIRGFYDTDADFNPFFSIRNQPTQGDVGGGAFVDISVSPPIPRRISFGHIRLQPDGQVVAGVAVTLGAVVNTERPIFELDLATTRAIDSTEQLSRLTDSLAREDETVGRAPFRIRTITPPGTPPSSEWLDALTAAGHGEFNFNPPAYSFYFRPVDGDLDGGQDAHPVLGAAGVNWYEPIIIMRRALNPIELAAGIPNVLMIASIRVTLPLGFRTMFTPKEVVTSFDVLVPPVAVLLTNPAEPILCRVPVIPPPRAGGTTLDRYEGDDVRWIDCQPLPSGNYDVNVLNGIAGGTPGTAHEVCMIRCLSRFLVPTMADTAMCTTNCDFEAPINSDTGFNIAGGQYASQSWGIPNELGCPDVQYRGAAALNQLDPPREDGSLPDCSDMDQTLMLMSQSRESGYSVTDPAGFRFTESDDTAEGHGHPVCQEFEGTDIMYASVSETMLATCCPANVTRLCGLPLCPSRTADVIGVEGVRESVSGSRAIRELRIPGEDFIMNADGTVTPLCTPFRAPVECCRFAAR